MSNYSNRRFIYLIMTKLTAKKAQYTNDKLNSLSVFFPCYNEQENIDALLTSALKIIPTLANKYEIIIVNDGSKDNTSELAHKWAKKNKHIKVIDQRNKGYGGAVKIGFKNSQYEWVFFTDADLQFNLKELKKFVKKSNTKLSPQIIIGYRKNRAEGFKRHLIAEMLKVWNRIFLGFPAYVKDIDCAFKLIKSDVIKHVGPLKTTGAMTTTEFLLKAHKLGYHFEQIGVKHYNRVAGEPTGSNPFVILKAVKETFILIKMLNTDKKFTKKLAKANANSGAQKVLPRFAS